jgi:hypothetical protein
MDTYPQKSSDTSFRVLGDEAVIVNFKDSFFYNLNRVGTFIWNRCDGRHSVDEIARALTQEFEVSPETASHDCREFLDELAQQGLLRWKPGPEVQNEDATT